MKLHWSPRSPFVRKVMVFAHDVGVAGRIECVRTVAAMMKPHPDLMIDNPLSKIPTLVLDNGTVLYDSSVICEYLDHLHDGSKLFPLPLEERMTALRRQALGDGLLDALVLWRGDNPLDRHIHHRAADTLGDGRGALHVHVLKIDDAEHDLLARQLRQHRAVEL